MRTVLVTGAAGGIGTRLRTLLDGVYPNIRWSDIRRPTDMASHQTFVQADLADLAQVEKLVDGVDGVVHLGGESVEQSWERILRANIVGCYNLLRRRGGRRCSGSSLPRRTTLSGFIRGSAGSAPTNRSGPIRVTA